ncbi:MAG: hypothetical protein WC730_03450 [Patescibacteria group bacterium]|jgi:hypothetical protein
MGRFRLKKILKRSRRFSFRGFLKLLRPKRDYKKFVLVVVFLLVFYPTLGLAYYELYYARGIYLPSPREYLKDQCEEHDLDFVLLDSIVYCESNWRMVKNSQSTAFGYFQILDGTEATTPMYSQGLRKYDPFTNIDMGVFLYERDSWYPWVTSKNCWWWRYQRNATALK